MKKSSEIKKKSIKSTETISHFHCGHCAKWWSIGDAPKSRKNWHCPWCGKVVVL